MKFEKEKTEKTLMEYINETNVRKKAMYAIYWNFYGGKHWKYEREEVPQLTFNYCKAFVNKSVAFLIGNGFKINSEDKKAEKILNEVWKSNQKELFLLEMVQATSVLGDGWIKVGYDDKNKKIKLSLVNPIKVTPFFEELRNNVIEELLIVHKYKKGNEKKVLIEHITSDTLWETLNGEKQNERKNILNEIPVVHISNMPIPFDFYGESDLKSLINLNKEYNEKATDFSETLDYQGSPVVVIKGAKAKNLERGPNKVWGGLPVDANVDLLEMGSGLKEAKEYLISLKQSMHEMASVPEEALGKTQPISNTSGVALEIRYKPLIEKTKVKRRTYGTGIEEINKLILKTLTVKEDKKFTTFENEVIFESPFPKDKSIELQNYQMELNMGVESRKSIAKQLGKDNLDELMKEVDEDRKSETSLSFLANQEYPDEPNDDDVS